MYTSIPQDAAPLRPESVYSVLIISQGPVLGELPVGISPVGLSEHNVQMPVIPVRCDPREYPTVRIVGKDILRLAPQAPTVSIHGGRDLVSGCGGEWR